MKGFLSPLRGSCVGFVLSSPRFRRGLKSFATPWLFERNVILLYIVRRRR